MIYPEAASYPRATALSDGRVMMTFAHPTSVGKALACVFSSDGGKTWAGYRRLCEHPTPVDLDNAFPLQLADGTMRENSKGLPAEPYKVTDPKLVEAIRDTVWTHELTDGLESEVDRARRLYEWVRDEIPHSKDAGHEIVTCRASEVLRHRTGICYAKSHLLAAMLRAVGIPAGFCYQILSKDPPYHGTEVHGLNGIFLSSVGCWIRLDARGNTGAINAEFSLDQEQLAFHVEPTRGEYTDETIYAEPLPVVVNCLRRFRTRSEMWPHLPESLDLPCPD